MFWKFWAWLTRAAPPAKNYSPVAGCRHWVVEELVAGVICGGFCGRPVVPGQTRCEQHMRLDIHPPAPHL